MSQQNLIDIINQASVTTPLSSLPATTQMTPEEPQETVAPEKTTEEILNELVLDSPFEQADETLSFERADPLSQISSNKKYNTDDFEIFNSHHPRLHSDHDGRALDYTFSQPELNTSLSFFKFYNGFQAEAYQFGRSIQLGGKPLDYPLTSINPVANGDAFTISANNNLTKNGSNNLVSNDENFRANQYEVVVTQTTSNGTLSVSANGDMSYTPNANYSGSDSFQYQLRHVNSGRLSEVVTVNIDVNASATLGSGSDSFALGDIANLIETTEANFAAGDTITGGTSTDTINFSDAATITTAELTNKTGLDVIRLNADGNSIEVDDAFVDASDNDKVTIDNQTYTITSLDVTDLNDARTVEIAGTGSVTLAAGGQTVYSADGVNTTIITGTGSGAHVHSGSGQDTYTSNGGNGDRFYFNSFSDSTVTNTDIIHNFNGEFHNTRTDRMVFDFGIDLTLGGGTNDGNKTASYDTANTGTSASWSGVAGELIHFTSGGYTFLQIDSDGDLDADFSIQLDLINGPFTIQNARNFYTTTGRLNGSDNHDAFSHDSYIHTINAGGGDDYIRIDSFSHGGSIDGGDGIDNAFVRDSGAWDLSTHAGTFLQNIEYITLNTDIQLTLTAQDVLDMSSSVDYLFVRGDANDSVTSTGQGWSAGATLVDSYGDTFNIYTSGSATLYVQDTITTVTLS